MSLIPVDAFTPGPGSRLLRAARENNWTVETLQRVSEVQVVITRPDGATIGSCGWDDAEALERLGKDLEDGTIEWTAP